MISLKHILQEGLVCEQCGQGFCEIIDKDYPDFKNEVKEELQLIRSESEKARS